MTTMNSADSLHRLIKQAIDSGAAASIAEAQALFQGFRLAIAFDTNDPSDPVEQATLLTAAALARRVFLGGVTVSGRLDEAPTTPCRWARHSAKRSAHLASPRASPSRKLR